MDKRREGRGLPAPATQSDMYGAAVVEELERLNDNIEAFLALMAPAQPEPETGEVELKEPAQPVKKPAHRDAKKAAD